MLPFVTVPSSHLSHHTSTCIILHGLGDSGHGWTQLAQILSQKLTSTKFILPHAPKRNVTLNGGFSMPAWYDIIGLDENSPQDQEGILKSSLDLLEIIAEEERNGVSRDRIVIGGFSQGGAVALTTGLLHKHIKSNSSNSSDSDFAGILALSTYLPIHEKFIACKADISVNTPIYMAHGTRDQVISYKWAERSFNFLRQNLSCERVEFESIPGMQHSVDPIEIDSVVKFLKKVFKY